MAMEMQANKISSSSLPTEANRNKVALPASTGSETSIKTVTATGAVEKCIALACYCCASVMMTVTNRYIFGSGKADMNFFLLALQAATSLSLLLLLRLLRVIHFDWICWEKARSWLHVVVLLVGMIFTASKGLHYLHVSNFTVCKNLMIVFMTVADIALFDGSVNETMVQGLLLIIAGSVIGGYSDLEFSLEGYSWLLANCLSSGMYLVEMRRMIKKVNFKDFETVFYNNTLSLPILVILSAVVDDWALFIRVYWMGASGMEERQRFLLGVGLSCVAGFGISYASAWCLRVLSTTTYSVAGALNKLPVSISGLLFFKQERNFSIGNITSILFAFVGGCFFSVGQMLNQRQRDESNADPETQPIIQPTENKP